MPNKNYIAGRNFEYKVKKYYEKQGYTVLRTSGSHGFADLIAIKHDYISSIIFIQCKNHKPTNQDKIKLKPFDWLAFAYLPTSAYNLRRLIIDVMIVYPDMSKKIQSITLPRYV
jgi:Holliday junction resolvase-like predicted endonuclease